MRFVSQPAAKRIVSLTPLIDVVFILLIFFMLVSQYSEWNHIDVSAPAPSDNPPNHLAGNLLIRISENGRIDIAGTAATLDSVVRKINLSLADNPDQMVLIKPAERLPVQELIKLLDELRVTGIDSFSIIK